MPRTNKITARVVPENKGAYQDFLNFDERARSRVSDLLRSVKSHYEMMAFTHKEDIDYMSCLEEITVDSIDCEENIDRKKGPVMAEISTIQVINTSGDILKEKKIARIYRAW